MNILDKADIAWLKLNEQALQEYGLTFSEGSSSKTLYILGYITGYKDAISKG